MTALERGGAAAASTLERLREAQRPLQRLELSPDVLLMCREDDVLAPLVEWGGANPALAQALDALAALGAQPAEPWLVPRQPPVFPPASPDGVGRAPDGVGRTPDGVGRAPDGVGRAPAPAVAGSGRLVRSGAKAAEARRRVLEILTTAEGGTSPVEAPAVNARRAANTFLGAPPGDPAAARWPTSVAGMSAARVALRVTPDGVTRQWRPGLAAHEESPPLGRSFAYDEAAANAWNQFIPASAPTPHVDQILAGTASHHVVSVPPADPISLLLASVVDRGLHRPVRPDGRTAPPGASPAVAGVRDDQDDQDALPRIGAVATGQRGLRRLAGLGESVDAGRVVNGSPASGRASGADTRLRPVPYPSEPADLADDIARVFRREALRHGILPQEEAP